MFTFSRAHSHALTNATRRHEYFRGLSRLLPVPGVLVSFLELRFLGKMNLLALRGHPQPLKNKHGKTAAAPLCAQALLSPHYSRLFAARGGLVFFFSLFHVSSHFETQFFANIDEHFWEHYMISKSGI